MAEPDEWPEPCSWWRCDGYGVNHYCVTICRNRRGEVSVEVWHHTRGKTGWWGSRDGRARSFHGTDREAYRKARSAARRAAQSRGEPCFIRDLWGGWGLAMPGSRSMS